MATTTTITVDAALKGRLVELARQAGQEVDEFVEALLRRIADADVRFERGVPTFPRRPAHRPSPSMTSTGSPTVPTPNRSPCDLAPGRECARRAAGARA